MRSKSLVIGFAAIIIIIIAGIVIYTQYSMHYTPSGEQESASSVTSKVSVTTTLMKLTSSAFEHNNSIPSKYTCDSDNISPPLEISQVPEDAASLVLIVDDPDAPSGDFVHWTVFNIPPTTTKIAEGTAPQGIEAMTDFGKTGWGGPCPPAGSHRYFFKLYALDMELDLDNTATKAEIETSMTGHVLDRTELLGTYMRQ